MSAQHWRAEQLCSQRDVLRFVAIAAICLLIAHPDRVVQSMSGIAFVIALYSQFRTGIAAREIDEAAANLCFETDPNREAEARKRLDLLVIRSRWHDRLWQKPMCKSENG